MITLIIPAFSIACFLLFLARALRIPETKTEEYMEYTNCYCKDEHGNYRLNPVPGDTEEMVNGWIQPIVFTEIPEKFPEDESEENRRDRGDDEDIHQVLEPDLRLVYLFHDQGKYEDDDAIRDIPDHETKEEREEDRKQRAWIDLPVLWCADHLYEKFKGLHNCRIVIEGGRIVHLLRTYLNFNDNDPLPEGIFQCFFCPFQVLFGDPALNQERVFCLTEFAEYTCLFVPVLKHFFKNRKFLVPFWRKFSSFSSIAAISSIDFSSFP